MSQVLQFPTAEEPPPENIIWTCSCGCTTFHLRPGTVAQCANCKAEVVSEEDDPDGPLGGWKQELEPPVPADVPEDPIGHVVIDFNDNPATLRNFIKTHVGPDVVFVIIGQESGEINTYGTIEGKEQIEWFDNRVGRARELLTKELNQVDDK